MAEFTDYHQTYMMIILNQQNRRAIIAGYNIKIGQQKYGDKRLLI